MKSEAAAGMTDRTTVAPARGRGLKFCEPDKEDIAKSRPREGAWIEICRFQVFIELTFGRPREGAWIEMGSSRFCLTR